MLKGTNDITVIQIKHPQGKTIIFNIYNDCTHSDSMTAVDKLLSNEHNTPISTATDSMLWCGNFNWHHPMWDKECNNHLFMASATREAEDLISLLADYSMTISLPRKLPTLQSMVTGNWTRVDNVFCTDNLLELITSCDTRRQLCGPGTDHVPILTTIDIQAAHRPMVPYRNFRMTDWEEFRERLTANLADHPMPRELSNKREFNSAVSSLTQALQDTIEEAVPLSKPILYSKHWWNSDLSLLKKEKNQLNHLLYIHQACTDHPSHAEHWDVCNKYATAIQAAKAKHWEDYLEEMNEDLLWGANRYISSPAGDGGKARIPTLSTMNIDGTSTLAETNEEKSKILARTFFPPNPTCPSTQTAKHIQREYCTNSI